MPEPTPWPITNTAPAGASEAIGSGINHGIDRVFLKDRSAHIVQGRPVRRSQKDRRRITRFQRFLPAGRAEAPPVPGLEPGEPVERHRRAQVVPGVAGKREELRADLNANRMTSHVFLSDGAPAGAIKSCQRVEGTSLQRPSQHVHISVHPESLLHESRRRINYFFVRRAIPHPEGCVPRVVKFADHLCR